jgi:hypothetical protein
VYPIGRPGRFRLTGFFMLIAPAGKRFECPKLDTAPALGMIKGPLSRLEFDLKKFYGRGEKPEAWTSGELTEFWYH